MKVDPRIGLNIQVGDNQIFPPREVDDRQGSRSLREPFFFMSFVTALNLHLRGANTVSEARATPLPFQERRCAMKLLSWLLKCLQLATARPKREDGLDA